jgi:hypothetical protein
MNHSRQHLYLGISVSLLYFLWKLALMYTGKQFSVLIFFPAAPLLFLTGIAIIYAAAQTPRSQFDLIGSFKKGGRIALVTALSSCFLMYVYYAYVDPTYFDVLNALKVQASGMQGAEADKLLKQYESMFNPFNQSLFTLSGITFFGLAMSLITSALYRLFFIR